jgi:hypothetical protein
MPFTVRPDKTNPSRLVCAGDLDENATPHLKKAAEAAGSTTELNVRGIDSINSIGIREWVAFVRALEAKGQVTYDECSVEFVSQLNMVKSFRGKANIRSLMRAYVCDDCSTRTELLLTASEHFPGGDLRMPSVPCPKCGTACVPEVDDDEHFEFLAR